MPKKEHQRVFHASAFMPAERATPWRADGTIATQSRLRACGAVALIFALTLVAYWPTLWGGLLWDDAAHVTRPDLRTLEGLRRIWFDLRATQQYYPLLHTAFWLEHKLWGDATLGYHLVNVLLHATAASLVYAVLRKLLIPGALFAAVLFALHPVHVESVAWITEQKNTLSAVFYLSAMWFYLAFDDTRQNGAYWLALGLFVLGLLTKTVVATLPAALLVIFWWRRGRLSWQRDVRPLLPWFLLGAVAGLFTAWVERKLIGAEGSGFAMTFVERGLLASRAPWFYVWKLIWPANLMFFYPRWEIDPRVWWQWLFPAATLATFIVLWAIRHRWRAPIAAGLLFVGTLFPALGFLNVYPFLFSFVADHFQYLASLGILVLAAAGASIVAPSLPPPLRVGARALSVAVVGILAVLTWRQCHNYADLVTLYRTTVDQNPNAWLAWNNLGVAAAAENRPREAIELYDRTIRLQPQYAEAYYNKGNALVALGNPQEAIACFHDALEIRPDYWEACNNLASALKLVGDLRQAIEYYERAVRIMPVSADVQVNFGDALLKAGDTRQAILRFERALELQPGNLEAHLNLAQAMVDAGQSQQAALHAGEVVQFQPSNLQARNILGVALGQLGRYAEAAAQFEEVVRNQPESAQARCNLMYAYAALQRPKAAIAEGETALELAQVNGETALARRIERWLANYRSQQALPTSGLQPQPDKPHVP